MHLSLKRRATLTCFRLMFHETRTAQVVLHVLSKEKKNVVLEMLHTSKTACQVLQDRLDPVFHMINYQMRRQNRNPIMPLRDSTASMGGAECWRNKYMGVVQSLEKHLRMGMWLNATQGGNKWSWTMQSEKLYNVLSKNRPEPLSSCWKSSVRTTVLP